MDRIGREDLAPLFATLRDVFAAQRDFLIDLDGKVGDSDLGLTMNKAFAAASESVAGNASDPLGRTIQLAGMAIAKAAPSTMGTLMATGFMRGGKALEAASEIGTEQMAAFWTAFKNGVVERGKAQPGDKTLLDVLVPICAALDAAVADGTPLSSALEGAAEAAAEGLEATKAMVAQHGKAACFAQKSLGLQDAGATVGFFLIEAISGFVGQQRS